jgi:hypothetical protein
VLAVGMPLAAGDSLVGVFGNDCPAAALRLGGDGGALCVETGTVGGLLIRRSAQRTAGLSSAAPERWMLIYRAGVASTNSI